MCRQGFSLECFASIGCCYTRKALTNPGYLCLFLFLFFSSFLSAFSVMVLCNNVFDTDGISNGVAGPRLYSLQRCEFFDFICLKGQGGLYGFTCWLLRIVFVWDDTLVEGAKANHHEADEVERYVHTRWMDAPRRADGLNFNVYSSSTSCWLPEQASYLRYY